LKGGSFDDFKSEMLPVSFPYSFLKSDPSVFKWLFFSLESPFHHLSQAVTMQQSTEVSVLIPEGLRVSDALRGICCHHQLQHHQCHPPGCDMQGDTETLGLPSSPGFSHRLSVLCP